MVVERIPIAERIGINEIKPAFDGSQVLRCLHRKKESAILIPRQLAAEVVHLNQLLIVSNIEVKTDC